MTLEYAGVDLSGYTTKYGFRERLRIEEGTNSGMSIAKKGIADVVAVKTDPQFVLKPLTPAEVAVVWALVRALPTSTYNTLRYTGADGVSNQLTAKLEGVETQKCLENGSRTLFNEIVLSFVEK